MQTDLLTIYGVEVRYPDDFHMPTLEEAERCVRIALVARGFLLSQLNDAGLEAVG